MYNYFRWYPNGKIIFMAPTKPLVRQQIDACYNIVAIPKEATTELTGTTQQTTRANLWREKRVFFITPHVLQNDLDSMPEIADNVKCLVLDEAHKAKGTYAYCEVMRKLQARNKYFRVLALSATPGASVRDILEVAKTLFISHLEVKTDESVDVAPYVYKRSLITINVPFDKKLYDVREEYLKIIEQYARVLIQNKVFTGNYSQLTKGRIFMTLKDYQAKKAKNVNIPNYNNIMKSLNICLTLYHGLELLTRHGLRGFLLYYEEHIQKPLLRGNQALHDIINDLTEYLGPLPDWRPLPDGSIPKLAKNVRFGHPKFRKLGDVLSAHFVESDDDATRVIVFFEYKDSVIEAHALLLEYHPLIRAKVFMGQSSITQKLQKSTLNIFRSGECNTLLSTSIGEEGLDVGEVDLIVCFDISSKSPIRMVQRMGRTGRKREGKIVVLITEGKEEELLRECLVQKKTLNESILNCSELHTHLYQENPKMIPDEVRPECKKIHITVRKEEEKPAPSKVTKTSAKRNKNSNAIKAMFESISSSQPGTSNAGVTYPETEDRLPQPILLCLRDDSAALENKQFVDFSKYLEKQRSWQSTFLIKHSKNSELLRSMLQFADSKRFNIPQTQIERTKSVKTGAGLYQSDIRSMFLKQKQTSISMSQLEVDVNLNEKVAEILIENKQYECSSNLQTEIRDYLTITYSNMFSCEMCDKYKDMCNVFKNSVKEDQNFNALSWTQPDNTIFDYLNKDTLNKFLRQAKGENDNEEAIIDEDDEFISTSIFDDLKFSQKERNQEDLESRTDSTNQIDSIDKFNNLVDSYKDDDFFSTDFITDLLINTKNKDVDKISSTKKYDEEQNSVEASEKCSEPVGLNLKLNSKSCNDEDYENTILFDDDFFSSDILAQFNKSSSVEKDNKPQNKIKECVRSEKGSVNSTPEKANSPRKSFKFKRASAIINKTADNILEDSDFFADDILNELSSIDFNYDSRQSRDLKKKKSSPNGSFKTISEIDQTVVLADIISDQEFAKNDTIKSQTDLEKDKKITNSDDDDFMDYTSIFAEMVKQPTNNINNNDGDSDDTILNLTDSDCDEVNSLNQAFVDQNSTPKANSKSIDETFQKSSREVSRNDCISPDIFSDSDPCTPELDKDVLDNSQDRTILFTQKSARNLENSPRTSRSSTSTKKSPSKLLSSDSESVEKSPSLWNLSKLYSQTSRDFNGTSVKRNISESIESLSFSESMFNGCEVPDEDFTAVRQVERVEKKPKGKRKMCLALNSSFLDIEAMVDGSQSADEDEVDLNEYDASFVNDASQDVANATALHGFYLKTIRSPTKKLKGFKIPALPKMDKMKIFSQIEPTQNDTYLEDSFCVDVLTQNISKEKEFDILEEAERILKNRKRRKKSASTQDDNKKKRRRIVVLSDSD